MVGYVAENGLGHFWKNGARNGQLFSKRWMPYGSPDQTDKLKSFVGGSSSYDLGTKNGRSGCKFTINRAVFDGKPIFDLEASWVCLRGILWIQASHQYLGAPSGGFFRPKNRLFGKTIDFDLKLATNTWARPPGFFPSQKLTFHPNQPTNQLGPARRQRRRRASNLGHIPDQHGQEKISA